MLEAAIAAPLKPGDVDAFIQRVRIVLLASNQPILAAVRMEGCPVLSPLELDQYAGLIKRDNPRVLKVGYLLERRQSQAATQFEQLIREGNHASRRFFYTKPLLRAFLAAELDQAERARLDEFLAADLASFG